MDSLSQLPIESVLPELRRALLARTQVVLTAQPGAGKSTRVPLALMQEPWLGSQKIVMLEPRRLAARAVARHMASLLGEEVGNTVGYRVRMDTRVSAHSRLEVVTEGVLTRMLQHDPSLQGYGAVIFDEFHERSLQGDLGLALCLDVQNHLREDLRVLVMSATLDCHQVAFLLGQAPVIVCEGRQFPVETRYLEGRSPQSMESNVVSLVKKILSKEAGNVVVFLPGGAEIRRVERLLREKDIGPGTLICPLYGDLPSHVQDQAIQPPPDGMRKVVLATPIAETSLTIDGVRIVVDTGLVRVPRFDPRSGMTRLETIHNSRASADQRRGRAGRVEAGICYRLWSEGFHGSLLKQASPEILETDLSSCVLELALWGITDPQDLAWLNPPPAGAFAQARELLQQLEALDGQGRITEHGRAMAEFPLHPRLAHMVLKASSLGLEALACDLAALLGERDVWKFHGPVRNADVRPRLEAIRHLSMNPLEGEWDQALCRRIRQTSRQLRERLFPPHRQQGQAKVACDKAGLLLAYAYPDRIAGQVRGQDGRYRLANGRGAYFAEPEGLSREHFLVIPHLDGQHQWAKIFLAAPVGLCELEEHCSDFIHHEEQVVWNDREGVVDARKRRRLGALMLEDQPISNPDSVRVLKLLLQGIRKIGLECLPWTKDLRNWQARVEFLRGLGESPSSWPDVSDKKLLDTIDEWLGPFLSGFSRLDHVQNMDLKTPLYSLLSWNQHTQLDRLAPTHWVVPTGSRLPLVYDSGIPILAVRLQEMFGTEETPRIADGAVPLMLHLLSPARRPVQVTRDLKSFWLNSYQEVRKELKGRYPKHHWPEDPLNAEPTRLVKRSSR